MTRLLKMILIGIMFSLTAVLFSVSIQSDEVLNNTAKVLFISSYNAGFDTLPDQVKGLQSVFEGTNVILDIDYMDTKQHSQDIHYDNYFAFLRDRIEDDGQYDSVIVGDDNGLQFLMDYREQIFPDVPIVFFCVNDLERANKANAMPLMTGIVEGISLESNLDMVADLFPDTKRMIGIVDNTSTGVGDAESFIKASEAYPEFEFGLLNVSEYTFEEVASKISEYEEGTVLFYLSMFRDASGQSKTIDESVALIGDNAKVPVIRMSIGGVGAGVFGGNMVSYEEQGRLAGEMTMSILKGVDPNDIKMISQSPNKYYFDYNMIEKFGLSLRDIPAGAIILNEPTNFFEENRRILIPGFLIIATLSIFMLVLIQDNRKLKEKDKELSETNTELSAMYEEMAATEEELRNNYDKLLESQKELNASEERYRVLANTDTLTSLNNRYALMRFLDDYVRNPNLQWHLLYLDLDNFKYINDTRGHIVGDIVLKKVANRLLDMEGEVLYLSRLGGDEFVVIVEEKEGGIEGFLKKLMASTSEPVKAAESEFYVSFSVGGAIYPRDGMNRDVLIRKADMALYKAKAQGKGRFTYYDESMGVDMSERLLVQNRLRHAVMNNELEVFFQPQMKLKDNSIAGVEVLVRWRDPNGNCISPSVFIPIAEEQGIIGLIDRWVYEESARKAKKWQERYGKGLFYSVNVSAVELMDTDFASNFLEILSKYDIDGHSVAVEVTETIFIDGKENAVLQLEKLRRNGVEIHLDDFGTGYSSLNYLIQLPLDVLKIDRSFINGIASDNRNIEMASHIVGIAHMLGLRVIAEGTETQEQIDVLRAIGCDIIQGYHFARPMSYEALNEFY